MVSSRQCWGKRSSLQLLTFGMSQGSILLFLLFNIYTKTMGEMISLGSRVLNMQMIASCPSQPWAIQWPHKCLKAVWIWMRRKKLRINPDKTEWLWVLFCFSFRALWIWGFATLVSDRSLFPFKSRVQSGNYPRFTTPLWEAGDSCGQVAQIHLVSSFLKWEALQTIRHTLITLQTTLHSGPPVTSKWSRMQYTIFCPCVTAAL